MNPGTIIFDNEFIFSDGSKGKKILVVLNDGCEGYYIIVKTTSKGAFKGINYGCQSNDRYPNFFLPAGSCCLKENTWIQLDQFFEFTSHLLLSKHFSGQMNRVGLLEKSILKALLECTVICEDISGSQEKIIRKTLAEQ